MVTLPAGFPDAAGNIINREIITERDNNKYFAVLILFISTA
jgi:hypothetical protein